MEDSELTFCLDNEVIYSPDGVYTILELSLVPIPIPKVLRIAYDAMSVGGDTLNWFGFSNDNGKVGPWGRRKFKGSLMGFGRGTRSGRRRLSLDILLNVLPFNSAAGKYRSAVAIIEGSNNVDWFCRLLGKSSLR